MSDPPQSDRNDPDRRSLERVDIGHLPIGVYLVGRDGAFQACNEGVRMLLALEDGAEHAASLPAYLETPDDFPSLTAAALAAEESAGGFQKAVVALRVAEQPVFVENYLTPLRDPVSNEVVGFLGCMADITEEHVAARQSEALKQKVEELTFDIGRILHANTSTLLMVNQTLSAAATALSSGEAPPQEGDIPEDRLLRKADELADGLTRLLDAGDEERRLRALPKPQWEMLSVQADQLRRVADEVPVRELQGPTLRRSAAGIADACRAIEAGFLPREVVRDVNRLADDLLRQAAFYEVLRTQTAVVQMDFTLRALRDFVTTEVRPTEGRRRLGVAQVVQEAIKQLADFARASNVDIVWRERGDDLRVTGHERDLVRAVSNLLHNAIKYSWRRDAKNSPWVAIRVVGDEAGRDVSIEFETWGVPITPNEIDGGLVFQMGYRGKLSKDRGRLGTGIGLTDTQRVARVHGGEVAIESRPAHSTSLSPDDRDYFERPFLTRVTLHLPQSS